jgi:alcohol dehydrogenase class IV
VNLLTDEGQASSEKVTQGSKVPIISIPTSLSAGEYSDFAGGTNDETHRKHSFQAPILGPRLIILDPELTATTPDKIWLSTGIRAVDHCVEILCSNVYYEETDECALKGLGMLVPGLLRCKQNRNDYAARLDCQLGSVEAMAACTNVEKMVQVGASHGIGHQVLSLSLVESFKMLFRLINMKIAWPSWSRPRRDELHPAPSRVQI